MGTAVSKRRSLRNEAVASVAAKVRAARAFGDYLSQNHPEGKNGADHLLAESYVGQEDSPEIHVGVQNKRRLSLISDGKFQPTFPEEAGEKLAGEGPKPRVYTISSERPMLSQHQSESMELVVLKGTEEEEVDGERSLGQPLHNAGSSHNISRQCKGSWPSHQQGSKEYPSCAQLAVSSQHPFDVEHHHQHHQHHHHHHHHHHHQQQEQQHQQHQQHHQNEAGETGWRRKKLERMYSIDRVSDEVPIRTWLPKENLFTFQTATTTMQANFRKHLRMVGSRRMKAQTFAERRERSFSRSWSDPTPIKPENLSDSRESHEFQDSCCAIDKGVDLNWEVEKELEAAACSGEDFVPPKIMLISSKVPKAEYVPTIIRRDDPSIIPILYDHEHATFDDILEEIEKKLNIYRKGCKIWKMLIFCQGGPGHLYLLKNKVATFAKVEKEEDMIYFWKRLGHLMSKLNPVPNVIHIMGCYVLGNHNGEKLFQNLKNLMSPCCVTFESPLELSAQGKEMIETYFDFRLYRVWKTRQHSKLLDYDDIL
uniref:NMDA receptor synaptonuclear signaling and neuronal migration factor n=1 Tax=Naja naja TaxID=35670 RepID=A0A8C6VMR7_NAJNA